MNAGHTSISLFSERLKRLTSLASTLDLDPDSPLYDKVHQILEGLAEIWRTAGGCFQRTDVAAIQELVMSRLSPADFRQIACLSFATWGASDRLSGPGLPHIKNANQCIAQKIADIVADSGIDTVSVVDLGAGLLGTTESIVAALVNQRLTLRVVAVDATPALVALAETRAAELCSQHSNLDLEIREEDMVGTLLEAPDASYDFVTVAFAIHHLHPEDQRLLVGQAQRVLKAGGALLIADPQEGKSDFNLNSLIYDEPEALFAAFTSPDGMCETMEQAGLHSAEVLMRDDVSYSAYVVCGRRA